MCTIMLLLCVGVASSARLYDQTGRVQGSLEGVDEPRDRQHRLGPSDGPDPYGGRYGDDGLRPPGGPPGAPERRGIGDRSNEITNENIDRIRTSIYSNVPTDRQRVYADAYKHDRNGFSNRHSENDRAGDSRAGDDERSPDVGANQFRGDGARTNGDKNAQRDNASTQSARPRNDAKNSLLGKPVSNSNVTEGRGVVEESTWVWSSSVDTSTATATTPQDLDNRASFAGDNCPTGQVRVKDAVARRVTTDGLLSALARLRRPPPPLPHPPAHRHSDGRTQPSKIHSPRPSPEHATGVDSMTVARGDDSPERLGGALRRLHYRATRRAHSAANRHHTSSKAAVMSSSTASDKTINTSTDSAATALTSVTGTDDSMDAEQPPCLMDEPPPPPPATAPPSYHRARASCDYDAPAHPHSAAAAASSRFVFDVPPPDPDPPKTPPKTPPQPPPVEKRNKIQVSQTSGPSTSIQIPFDPKLEQPKSPKANTSKYETHFKFDPEVTKRRGSEPRLKNKQKLEKQEYYKEEVAKLRRQLEGTEVFTTTRRRSSTHQHSVPPVSSRRQSTAAQVHVTANPLESAASIPSGRTTIVVQQPSLSLDYGGCSTILVRDEDGRRASRQDHIQQLLDVTSQFTSEDLHEFDKRYGSPHHSRSQSVKAARTRTGERQLLGLPQQRARVASMPNTGVEEEYYRLRHFSITGKGVVNRGDSLRSRRSRSNTSVASSASSTEPATRASAPCSLASSRDSSAGLSAYRVLVLGGAGVGKSSLVGQFMTSEYLHAYDTSIDDESGEKSVCVLLAGEESEITFLDEPPDYMVTEGCAHGYCVVYSTADRASFAEAERRLQALWAAGHTARRAVILVGNKADLARSRVVPTDEGKALATSYECKFIETSVGINHNVDELLVGLLTQIRLKQQHAERARKRSASRKTRARARSPADPDPPASAASTPRKRTRLSASVKVRGLLGRVWARDSKSKSCENLHVL